MTMIRDGLSGDTASVDFSNRLTVHSVGLTEIQEAVTDGNAYNVNTGWITITGASDSTLLYFENGEEQSFVVDAIAVGVKNGDIANIGTVTIVKNPTSVSFSDPVDMNQNRNFGSSNTLGNSSVYKGSDGATTTGGDDIAIFAQGDNGRLFATVDFEIPKGKSMSVKYDPELSSGSNEVYVALIGHVRRSA
jgi:hypothetical protein